MITFASDYTTGATPEILERLMETNLEPVPGYGEDPYCASAKAKIREACGCPDAEIYFLTGGTQTNQVVISTMLANYEGVVSAQTGHVNSHEAGAIEYTGHKVLSVPQHNGRMDAGELEEFIRVFYADDNHEHMVYPGMVYISHPTEYGTLYSKQQLTDISAVCRKYDIPLFLDGARLGYGLASLTTDVTLKDIAKLADVFYIGGTKVGALCGEALVFTTHKTPKCFVGQIKQHGALLAKGRLNGLQFDTLFTDDLYMKISRHAIDRAEKLKSIFAAKGYRFFLESPTNQQFVILENSKLEELKTKVGFGFWEEYDETHTVVRFATSWSTTDADLAYLDSIL